MSVLCLSAEARAAYKQIGENAMSFTLMPTSWGGAWGQIKTPDVAKRPCPGFSGGGRCDQAATSRAEVSNTLLIVGRFMIMGCGAFFETLAGLTLGSFWATSALSQLPTDSLPDTAIE